MPSLKMKPNSNTDCLREKSGLEVCQKSNKISKVSGTRGKPSRQATDFGNCVQNYEDVHVQENGIESVDCFDCFESLNVETLQCQKQPLPLADPANLERMEPTGSSSQSNVQTIFSPYLESEVQSESSVEIDAVRDADHDVPLQRVEDSDVSSRSSCNVSDFYISDMFVEGLPFAGNSVYDDIIECPTFSNYRCDESFMFFDIAEECMILPNLEDTIETSNSHDGGASEEAFKVSDDSGLYLAIHQIRSCNEESVVSPYPDTEQGECFDPHTFIRNLPDLSDAETNCWPTVLPKEKSKRITLVLDLDETLVHSTLEHCDGADFTFPVFFNMKEHLVYVKKRPHLQTFLERVAEIFEIVVFTASQSIYAKQLLDILDPDGKLISRRAYRESCIFSDGSCTKDLTVLGVDLAKVFIIDNSPQVFRLQVNNGIPIKSWFDDPSDCALITLLPFLETLADANDVRPIIAKRFGNKE